MSKNENGGGALVSGRRGCLWWATVVIGAPVVMLSLLFLAAYLTETRALDQLPEKYPTLGKMVDVGNYNLHLYCTGDPSAEPVVIISPGLGAHSLHWFLVQPEVAAFTYVCAYDRPGSGWSFVEPEARTYQAEVDEVRTMLQNSGLTGPFVLVGHSYGGGVVQVYASQYPEDVVGLILVDSVARGLRSQYPEEHLQAEKRQEQGISLFSFPGVFRLLNWFGQYRTDPFIETLPTDMQQVAYDLDYNSRLFKVQTAYREQEAERERQFSAAGPLPNIPLIVLTRGVLSSPYPGESEASNLLAEQVWQDAQLELSQATLDGTLIVAEKSGHNIANDQPDLVIEAIRTIVEQVRLNDR